MDDIIQWLQRILIESSITRGGITITPLRVIGFLITVGVFVIIAKLIQRITRRFLTRVQMEEDDQERILWLIILTIVFVGLILGLGVIGINLTLLGRVLTASLKLGDTELSLAKLFSALVTIVVAVVVSKYLQMVLRSRVLPPFRLAENAQFLLLRFIHFSIIILGIFVGISLTGLRLNNVLVLLGGLSIGIGFGLQNIANNLISGIILIFERPVRVGDRVTVGQTFGTVVSINMRSTEIITLDNVSILVPNSQFISEPITNWTHHDNIIRLQIPVGVVHGSDTVLVKKALMEAAEAHWQVVKNPNPRMPRMVRTPHVRFLRFGDSALNFELLVWIPDVNQRFDITSELHFLIDQKFREYGITIAFPQRDVHLYYKSSPQLPLNLIPEDEQTNVKRKT